MHLPKLEKLAENPWALVAFGALAGVWLATTHERSEDPERGLVMGLVAHEAVDEQRTGEYLGHRRHHLSLDRFSGILRCVGSPSRRSGV